MDKSKVVNDFKKRLRDLRTEKGLSQDKLAEELGISKGAISYYETGQRAPDIVVLSAIADYFNVTTDYLLCRTEIKSPDLNKQAACKLTGLSDDAIEYLSYLSENGEIETTNVISEIITYPTFDCAVFYIRRAVSHCKNKNLRAEASGDEKKRIRESIKFLEKYGYELCEPSDNAYSWAMKAYEAFKYIIDDVISNISGTKGFVLRCNELAYTTFADMYDSKRKVIMLDGGNNPKKE